MDIPGKPALFKKETEKELISGIVRWGVMWDFPLCAVISLINKELL